jgi:two-component system response regulator GlrR
MNKILVVDDDRSVLDVIKSRMEFEEFQVSASREYEGAVHSASVHTYDLALVDLKLNGKSGIDLMEELHRIQPELPVIILTGFGSVNSAVDAMKRGACSYLTKPFEFDELFMQVRHCLEKTELSKEVNRLKNIVGEKFSLNNILGKSAKMRKVMAQVAQAADSDSIVYINGESGTGKELIAKSLHLESPRKDGPFVAINCAAIPETLLESELFGFEKGAFTGAEKHKTGLFAKAHGGTFFLDEISEMPSNMQAKLLRVLEDRKIFPLGGAGKFVEFDARILAASNKDLAQEVQQGRFREDLFYRIHVISITLPSLRDRQEDIPLLAKHFLAKHCEAMGKKINGFTSIALRKLVSYDWPGNVRELENAVESAVALSDRDIIAAELILPGRTGTPHEFQTLKDAKKDFEIKYLRQLIEFTGGNVTRAAKLAGKYRADLYELLKKHQLNPDDFRQK